jgi:hypothetical protein
MDELHNWVNQANIRVNGPFLNHLLKKQHHLIILHRFSCKKS